MSTDYQPVTTGEMLKDGSNPEGVDPVPPLNWNSLADFKDVKLYGMHGSPPCAKLKAYLIYYNVPYDMVEGTGKKGSDYKKMPVMDVNGRQVNDTYIILKNMIPALSGTGTPYNDEWESICSYVLPFSIEASLSPADSVAWMSSPYGFGIPDCMVKCCMAKVLMSMVIKPNIDKACKAMPDKCKVMDLQELGAKLKKDIGGQTFHGGNEPSNVDISFYGICSPFYFSGCENVTGMIRECGLQAWWGAMDQKIPMTKLFPPQ